MTTEPAKTIGLTKHYSNVEALNDLRWGDMFANLIAQTTPLA